MKHRQLVELASIKFCTIVPSRLKKQEVETRWMACFNFLRDNTLDLNTTNEFFIPDNEQLIKAEDIIIKRITPTFVNYIDVIPDKIYAGNNLIILTPNNGVYSRYIAMFLDERIESLSKTSSVGAVMKSVSRQHLEELLVPVPPYDEQVVLGDIWYNNIELKKMKSRLIELEEIKTNYYLTKYIKSFGGKNNG